VKVLLAAHGEAGEFLESSALPTAPPLTEEPGTIIGPYELIEEIGEGGLGTVFMALQKEPVRRKVALKVIRPGMDSRQVVRRFEAEQQALAMMDHPSIARMVDGGNTPSGRPYFAMELVNGMPVTEYCDTYEFTTVQRLELFKHICHAVQHAHQRGVIHRDLKPSNVLVTHRDGHAVPKVIDFGIAKAISGQLTEATLVTHFAQMIGTPLYMSPEQAELSSQDIDTRSDVYSLGVLLYELLTGSTPFDKQRVREAGFDEMRRIIREEEPPRPSDRISTLAAETTTVISARRKAEPAKLSQLLRGELDWIVMKALEKDRTRRYDSPNDLAKDIQRYLDDEPVEACPPSRAYQLRKLARKHRGKLAAAVSVAMILVASTVVSLSFAAWARDSEAEAKANLTLARRNEETAARERGTAPPYAARL